MFTLSQIVQAHSKVKSGADFPVYIQDLIALGVQRYDAFVSDGHTVYYGNDDSIESEAKYLPLDIAAKSDTQQFALYLKTHQQGQTDYMTFCQHAAQTGVERRTVNM